MNKLCFRDKAFKVILDVIFNDSTKMGFSKLEVNKVTDNFSVKYRYKNSGSILILVKGTGKIEFYYRLRNDVNTIFVTYFEPKITHLDTINKEFFVKLKNDFNEILNMIAK